MSDPLYVYRKGVGWVPTAPTPSFTMTMEGLWEVLFRTPTRRTWENIHTDGFYETYDKALKRYDNAMETYAPRHPDWEFTLVPAGTRLPPT